MDVAEAYRSKCSLFNVESSLLGNKGCKLLKQSNIAAVTLKLGSKDAKIESCEIDSIGVKWLCKANLSRTQDVSLCIENLILAYNKIGEKRCSYLIRTKISTLQDISLGWIHLYNF